MKLKTEVEALNNLRWHLACTMDYAKSLTAKGDYAYQILEILEQNLRNKINNLKDRLEKV